MAERLLSGLLAALLGLLAALAAAQDDYAAERRQMIGAVERHARHTGQALPGGRIDAAVLEAMRRIPRHEFVPDSLRDDAYENRPLPIGYGQTISQPFIVALMTDLLDVEPDDTVLEIGTGSGYQAAVLSPLAAEVYTIEIIPELGRQAASRFERLGLENVHARIGDGYYGWPEAAPFDGIVVTAAANHVPPPLIEQLAPGGRMVIPVGGPFSQQQLMLVEKRDDGSVRTRQLLPVRFVPFTRGGP